MSRVRMKSLMSKIKHHYNNNALINAVLQGMVEFHLRVHEMDFVQKTMMNGLL